MNRPDPLSVALSAARPIDDAPRVPLEVERLVEDHARRVSVDDHHAFRNGIDKHLVDSCDEIDHLAAEPVLDRLPARRAEGEVSRVLDILDRLEMERRSA
jgi:hypothetical protein